MDPEQQKKKKKHSKPTPKKKTASQGMQRMLPQVAQIMQGLAGQPAAGGMQVR